MEWKDEKHFIDLVRKIVKDAASDLVQHMGEQTLCRKLDNRILAQGEKSFFTLW